MPALCLTAALLDGIAKCPESLCPMSVLPPTGETCTPSPARTLLLGHRSYGLIRQSRLALLSFGLSLVQEVFAGCSQPLLPTGTFPTLSLRIFPRMLGPLPRRSQRSAYTCFFLRVIGLPPERSGSASRFSPRIRLLAGVFSRLQTFLYVQASEFARLPGRSYRCTKCRRAAETFTSGQNVLRCLCTHRIC